MKNKQKFLATILTMALFTISCKKGEKNTTTQQEKVVDSTYTVTVKIDDLTDDKIVFIKQNFLGMTIDTLKVTNGSFTTSGKFDTPSMASILKTDGDMSHRISLIVDSGETTIKGSFENPVMEPAEMQEELKRFIKIMNPNSNEEISKLKEGKSEEKVKAINDSIAKDSKDRMVNYLKNNANSYVSFTILGNFMKLNMLDTKTVSSIYDGFSEEIKSSYGGKKMKERLDVLKALSVGNKALDFTQNDVNGNPVTLSKAYKGKYVLVDFWASWCVPCRKENPNVLKAYNAYKADGFDVLGVSLDAKEEDWKLAIKEDGMPWKQVSDLKGGENAVAKMYGVTAIPTSFLVSPEGVIVAKNLRGEELMKKLEQIFKK